MVDRGVTVLALIEYVHCLDETHGDVEEFGLVLVFVQVYSIRQVFNGECFGTSDVTEL
jgi:hypothetical protein